MSSTSCGTLSVWPAGCPVVWVVVCWLVVAVPVRGPGEFVVLEL